jgi:hypothetical protein
LHAGLHSTDGNPAPHALEERAFLRWQENQETLVIQTCFKTHATNSVWILSLPTQPEIQPASSGTLPTLQYIFSPPLIHDVRPWWQAVLLALLTATSIFPLVRKARRRDPIVLSVLAISLLVYSRFITATPQDTIRITTLDSTNNFDGSTPALVTSTLAFSPLEAASFQEWIRTLNINLSQAPSTQFQHAVEHQETLVALTLQHPPGLITTPAIRLTFESTSPAYPAFFPNPNQTNAPPLSLYAFGPAQASLTGLRIKRCAQPFYPPHEALNPVRYHRNKLEIRHPELLKLARQSPVATALHGPTPKAGHDPLPPLRWYPYETRNDRRFTPEAATSITANVAAFTLLGTAILLMGIARTSSPDTLHLSISRLLIAAIGMTTLTYWIIPRANPANLRTLEFPLDQTRRTAREILRLPQNTTSITPLLPQELRTNIFTGIPLRMEDSPGNYHRENTPQNDHLLWYDANGSPHTNETETP